MYHVFVLKQAESKFSQCILNMLFFLLTDCAVQRIYNALYRWQYNFINHAFNCAILAVNVAVLVNKLLLASVISPLSPNLSRQTRAGFHSHKAFHGYVVLFPVMIMKKLTLFIIILLYFFVIYIKKE